MSDCQLCGRLRLNGMPIRKTEDGWQEARDPNPTDPNVKFACRQCAKERIHD